jgi:hypothetical protein
VGAKGSFPWSIAGGAGSVCAPVVELYEPVNTLKPVGENLRVADGPIARMAYLGTPIPFPTRMLVVRLANGGLFLWSPTEPDEDLRSEIDALGPVCHLVSPNKIHYAHVAPWKRAYPGAGGVAWGTRAGRLSRRRRHLRRGPRRRTGGGVVRRPRPARLPGEQVHGRGRLLPPRYAHPGAGGPDRNLEPGKVGKPWRWQVRLSGASDPDGKAPMDLRLTFLGCKKEARAAFGRMVAWKPERVIMAHGRPYERTAPRSYAGLSGGWGQGRSPPQRGVPELLWIGAGDEGRVRGNRTIEVLARASRSNAFSVQRTLVR